MNRFHHRLKIDEKRISELKSSQIKILKMKQRKQNHGTYNTVGKKERKERGSSLYIIEVSE